MKKLTVIIITQDEENVIEDCLKSVAWADEIIVVDALSTDKTVEICQKYTTKIFENPWPGFAKQKQYALNMASHSWVFSIDSDERITPALKLEIQNLLSSDAIKYNGFKIPRLSTFLGKEIKHGGWYPGYQLRLFRKDKTKLSNSRIHEGFLVDGECGYFKFDLLHHTHPTLKESLARMNRYSSLEALQRFEKKGDKKIRWYHFFINPFSAFCRQFLVKRGFLDGIHGLILAIITATVKLALYLKIWEFQNKSVKYDEIY